MLAWLTPFAALTRKGLNPWHWQVNRSVVQKQLFFTLETRSLPSGSARRLVLPRLLLDRSHKLGGLIGNLDETCPALGLFTLGTMRKLDGDSAGETCIYYFIKWNAIHNVQVQPTVAQAISKRLFSLVPPHQGSF